MSKAGNDSNEVFVSERDVGNTAPLRPYTVKEIVENILEQRTGLKIVVDEMSYNRLELGWNVTKYHTI